MPVPVATALAFADSIAANTHLSYPAYENTALLVAQLRSLCIKHLRDGFHTSVTNQAIPNYDPDSVLYARWKALGELGIRFNVVVSPIDKITINGLPPTADVLNQLTMEAGMLVETFEGANEMDNGTPVGWNGACVQWQQALYAAVKSMAQVWQPNYLPCLGPSLADPSRGPDIGNLSHWLDLGSIHCYAGGNKPSVIFPSCLQFASVVSGTKPIMATECGYHNDVSVYGGVSEVASGKYIPRMFLLNFMNGIVRSYIYELLDDSSQTGAEASFGLIRADGSVKPAFFAVKNMLSILSRENVALSPLNFSLGGPGVSQLLLQQGDGSWLLFLWQEVSCYNLNTKTDVMNPDVTSTLTLPSTMPVKVYRPCLQPDPVVKYGSTNSVSIPVGDHPTAVLIG